MKISKELLEAIITEETTRIKKIMLLKEEEKVIRRKLAGLNETGEWSDDEEGIAQKDELRKNLEDVKSMINPGVHFEITSINGFDKYQGAYANIAIHNADTNVLNRYRVWAIQEGYWLWIENFPIDNTSKKGQKPGFEGTTVEIADAINKKYSIMASHLNEKEAAAPAENQH